MVDASTSRPGGAWLPILLTFNGGYVDTAGFLALQGLFTAHVTGNFVTIAASLLLGTTGLVVKLAALPVFCGVVLTCRLLSSWWQRRGAAGLARLLALHTGLLALGCALTIRALPAADVDAAPVLLAGLLLVAGMAVQNALHKTHLTAGPPSTLMTGTTTQAVVDVADMLGGVASPEVKARARVMGLQIVVFALGCGAAAAALAWAGPWAFVLPPAIGLGMLGLLRRA